ncbi:MAG TPA: tetratricopeptide repeat protein [Candidatus Portnoybacteria bacterium]|nr:tetratricopeptide repeat protein [Candidatus Portnoybacteria bacterium]
MSWITLIGIILFVGGLAGILVILFRKIPTLIKLPTDAQPSLKGEISEEIKTRFHRLKYSDIFPIILSQLEKSLRRFRLAISRIDNLFAAWIKKARERSDIWTIRSRAWMEGRRLKKKEETRLLEQLDKAEVSQTIQKIEKEVAKDEDNAFKEKVEIVNSVEEETVIEPVVNEVVDQQPEEEEILTVSEEEKKYIDAIAENPKDVDSYRALCDIYYNQKSYSDARACFRQVLKLDPTDEKTKEKLESIKGLRSGKKK